MEELVKTFVEEYEGGIEQFEKQRYKNATILLSKSLFALCDLIILNKLKRLPKNHGERFRILEEHFPKIYPIIDEIFSHYTDAYSKPVLNKACMEIKNGITKISKIEELPEEIKKIVG
ncbi:MAG: hypothetical protein ABII01_04645 [Candidatus Woesearchaeota archaeon]